MLPDLQNIVVNGRKVEPEELYQIAKWALFGPRSHPQFQGAVVAMFGSRKDAIHEAVVYFCLRVSEKAVASNCVTTLVHRCATWAYSYNGQLTGLREDCFRRYAESVGSTLEFVPVERHYDDISLADRLAPLIETLSDREQSVIRMRFLERKTLSEVGEEIGVSRERARQIEEKALRKLQETVTTSGQKELLLSYLE